MTTRPMGRANSIIRTPDIVRRYLSGESLVVLEPGLNSQTMTPQVVGSIGDYV